MTRLQVDTELLARAGGTLHAIQDDLRTVRDDAPLRTLLGHDGLADTLDAFTHGWDDARASLVRLVGDVGEACREVADTLDDVDADLAASIRGAFG